MQKFSYTSANTVPKPVAVAPQSRAKPHLAYLDGLRAVAMLWVLLGHSVYNAFRNSNVRNMDNTPHWLYIPLQVFANGHYAVDIFIALSGFCLALPVALGDGELRGGAIKFFQKRARRILPLTTFQ